MALLLEQRAAPPRVYVSQPSRHLFCLLCDDGSFNEVVLPCGHPCCQRCATSWFARSQSCPVCRAAFPRSLSAASLPTNWVVMAQVDDLRVHCRYGLKLEGDAWVVDARGCPASLSTSEAAGHEAACAFAPTTCPFAGCGAALRRCDVTAHDAASTPAHLDGERSARLALEARLAAVERLVAGAQQPALLESLVARVASLEALSRSSPSSSSPPSGPRPAHSRRLPPDGPHTTALRWGVGGLFDHTSELSDVETVAPPAADAASGRWEVVAAPISEGPRIWRLAFAPPGSSAEGALCAAFADGHAKLVTARGTARAFGPPAAHEGSSVNGCAFSPDGSTVLTCSHDATLKLWDVPSGECVCTFTGHVGIIYCVAVSPDGATALSGGNDGALKTWSLATGECLLTLEGRLPVVCCCFSPDGRTTCSGGGNTTLRLCNAATGRCSATLSGHTNVVRGCIFDRNGASLLSCSFDATVRLWDPITRACLRVFTGHRDKVRGCAFFPDGTSFVSCGNDSDLRVWDVATGACTATLVEGEDASGGVDVTCVAVSHDGRVVASGDGDGALKLWARA